MAMLLIVLVDNMLAKQEKLAGEVFSDRTLLGTFAEYYSHLKII